MVALLALIGSGLAGCGGAPPSTSAATAPAGPSSAEPSPAATADPSPVAGGQRIPGPSTDAVATVSTAQRPVRITVPSIGVNSPLVELGIAGDGTLQVPKDFQRAGWLAASSPPGRQGPAVIAGHVDSTKGPAVFYRLADLKPGAKILITRGDGSTVSFAVDSVQQYSKLAFPTAAVYGPVPGPVLRLITCGGAFDRTVGHYRDNIVVYAS